MSHDRKAYRYCPYCGAEMETRQVMGRRRGVCPACGFIHFLDPKVGAGVLVEDQGKVLLVRRAVVPAKGKWCLPSGFVEYDEDPRRAAQRECREETGLEVDVLGLLDVLPYNADSRGPGIIIFYQARITGGRLKPGDDADAACFFGPDELPDQIAFRSNSLVLERWRAGLPARISDSDDA